MGMSAETLVCPACGTTMPANALLCPKCGRPNISSALGEPPEEQAQAASSSTALFGPSAFGSTVAPSPTQGSTPVYTETGIPKTVMPWETAAPEVKQEPAPEASERPAPPVG